MPKTNSQTVYLSADLIDLSGSVPTEIRLFRAGMSKAKDGRPHGLPGWRLDGALASKIIADAKARNDKFLIDYDHQTLYLAQHGQKAPAAGWYSELTWRDGDGLYATDVQWTEQAKAAILAKEYRYISPVILADKTTGDVKQITMAALVNHPALDGLNDLAAAHFLPNQPQNEEKTMDKVIVALGALLGLAPDVAEAALMAELDGLKKQLTKDGVTATIQAALASSDAQIAALSAQVNQGPDPSQWIPLSAFTELQGQLQALSDQINGDKVADLVKAALSDGRLQPALKDWATDLGKKDYAALSTFVANQKAIPALRNMQPGPGDLPASGQSAEEIAALASKYQAEQAAIGIAVDDLTAINHVTKATA